MFNRNGKGGDGLKGRFGVVAAMPGGVFDVAVASMFINILALAMPLALLQIYDRVIPAPGDETLSWLVAGVAAALALEALLRVGRSYVSGWMGARFEHMTGLGAMQRLLRSDITEFQKSGTGAYLERLNALAVLRDSYTGQTASALVDLPFIALYIGAIAYLAWPLAMVSVVPLMLFAAVALTAGRLRQALQTRMQADDRRFGFLIEVLGAIHTVKGLGMEEQMLRRYERLQETCADADYDLAAENGTALSLSSLSAQLAMVAVAGVGAMMVINGSLTVGGLLAAIVLAGRAAHLVEGVAQAWPRVQDAKIARARLDEILRMPVEKPTGLIELPTIVGAVDFENLTFDYGKGKDGEDLAPVFENLTFRIEPGETIGVVGGSGSGKTTLLFLMLGVLKPSAGTARIDGYDLRECDPRIIRHQVAYLPQEAVIFKGTLTENLSMFRDDRANDALDMAKLLGLDDVAAALPKGYDTLIGEGAEDKLTRGTRQRIGIARAMVDKPRVLLFDEANSFIDGAGDAMLRNLLARLRGRVTQVVVTQRPSMLRLADRVFQIQGTAIVDHDVKKRAALAAAPRPRTT